MRHFLYEDLWIELGLSGLSPPLQAEMNKYAPILDSQVHQADAV